MKDQEKKLLYQLFVEEDTDASASPAIADSTEPGAPAAPQGEDPMEVEEKGGEEAL
jgi:hypothetical protein